ncbi:MAG: solute carrier family 23 protein [Metamycoplasmataceae bacterium]
MTLKIDSFFQKYFKLDERNATIKKEIIGGISTFLAMMYILVVNPSFLSQSQGIINNEDTFGAIFLGTAISSFVATFIMGIFANVPITLAPGMGINAFFSFTVASQEGFGLNYYEALVCVFISGILYCLIAISPLRLMIIKLMPKILKQSIVIMMGFFLAYVGLVNIGIVGPGNPVTSIGNNFDNSIVIIGVITLLIGLVLYFTNVKYSIIITSLIGILMLVINFLIDPMNLELKSAFSLKNYNNYNNFPNMISNFFNLNNWSNVFLNPLSYVAIFTFLYIDFFDTSGAIFSIGKSANLFTHDAKKDDKWLKKVNYVDGLGTISGAILLNSSVTTMSESEVGIGVGARTGISSIVCSLLLLLSIIFWPIMGPIMPIGEKNYQPISGHAIFTTGVIMIANLEKFNWKKTFNLPIIVMTILFGMLSYSISMGISWSILVYTLFHLIESLIIKNKDNNKFKNNHNINYLVICLFLISVTFIIIDSLIKIGIIN